MGASPFGAPGTVALNSFYGGTSGRTKAELESRGPVRSGAAVPLPSGNNAGNLLTLPVILALGVLVWYAVKTYE